MLRTHICSRGEYPAWPRPIGVFIFPEDCAFAPYANIEVASLHSHFLPTTRTCLGCLHVFCESCWTAHRSQCGEDLVEEQTQLQQPCDVVLMTVMIDKIINASTVSSDHHTFPIRHSMFIHLDDTTIRACVERIAVLSPIILDYTWTIYLTCANNRHDRYDLTDREDELVNTFVGDRFFNDVMPVFTIILEDPI